MPAESSAVPEPGLTADTTFTSLGVSAALVEVLDGQGITAPFPVQAATLPDGLAGRDILGRARTGSGKTLGFSLPLVSRLAGGSTRGPRPRGLVLVPTRELATQVTAVLKPLARAMDLRVTTIFGGVSYGPQINALQHGTDIVVATPGRLADLIGQGECDLSEVEITVIDEADQMADLGFLPIVRRLLEATPGDGQRMLFSATLDAAIDVLARRFLHDPVLHSVDENSSPAEIEHHVLTVEPASRVAVIRALTGGEKRSLVFTRTKHGAERLARQLTDAGIPAAELHGNLRQGARSRNLAAFASGIARVMVATDIAARGIHIDGIDLVIHADPPADHKAYVHRSGRTARGGADGVVVTLQMKSQARDVTAMMRKAGITPHPTVAVDTDSDVLTEIAGPPAPRVTVSGKVSELVRPEDRLARNDRQGVGKPWEGRPHRDRHGDRDGDRGRGRGRDRKPREDRFRDRGKPSFEGQAARGQDERPARDERRPARDERPAGTDRGSRGDGAGRGDVTGRGDRGFGGGSYGDRGFGGGSYGDRQGRADSRDNRDNRYGRNDRDNRNVGRSGNDRDNRNDGRNGNDRGTNDWWPRAGGRPAQPRWNHDDRGRDTGRSPAGGQQSGPRAGRADRPQPGGRLAGSSRHGGYSAGRGTAGKRRDSGQGRHF